MQQQQPSSKQQQAEIPGSRSPAPTAPRLDAALDVVWLPPKQQG